MTVVIYCIAVMMGTVHHGGNYIIQEIKNVERCRDGMPKSIKQGRDDA